MVANDIDDIEEPIATDIPTPKSIALTLSKEGGELIATHVPIGGMNVPSCTLVFTKEHLDATLDTPVPIEIKANIVPQNAHAWNFEELSISAGDHHLAGQIAVDLMPYSYAGKIQSVDSSARDLARLFGGSCDQLNIASTFDNKSVSLNATAYGCKSPTVDFDVIRFDTPNLQDFSLGLAGKSKSGPLKLECSGTASNNIFTLDSFQATSSGHTVQSATPFSVKKTPDGLDIAPFSFTSDNGMDLQGQLLVAGNQLNGSLTASNLPLEYFEPFFCTQTLFGNVSGHLELSGTKNDPECLVRFASSNLTLWNPAKSKKLPLSCACELTVKESSLIASCEIEGLSQKKPASLTLKLPLDLATYSIAPRKKLFGTLQAEFDINSLLASYFDEDELMGGIVQLDVKLDGTESDPIFVGSLNWSEGRLLIPAFGTVFSNVAMTSHLQGNTLIIEKLTADDTNQGTFQAIGWIRELTKKSCSYHLEGRSQHFATILLDDSTVSGSCNIDVTGDLNKVSFKGAFDLDEAELLLTNNLSKDLPKLDITYVNDTVDALPARPFEVAVDLDFQMPKGVVRGMGLDSVWAGSARLFGKNGSLDVEGKIDLTAGTLEFASKTFTLTQGAIDFHGDLYKKSHMLVVATNDVAHVSTRIALQGPLQAPRITIQSNPAMSQKEILSWLLFNKSSSDISPIQGIQLGQTLLKLKGTNGEPDFIENLKQKLHIDRLDFGQSSNTRPQISGPGSEDSAKSQESLPNEVSVQVGKYISDGVIVIISKDVTNEVNRVGVEASLSEHLTAQANVGDDAQTELSLEWKLRY